MKQDNQPIQQPGCKAQLDEDAQCDGCGRFGAYRFGDRALCSECYAGSGSCCPEFGKDDLWDFEMKTASGPRRPVAQPANENEA